MTLVKSRSEHFEQDQLDKYEVAGKEPKSETNGTIYGKLYRSTERAY